MLQWLVWLGLHAGRSEATDEIWYFVYRLDEKSLAKPLPALRAPCDGLFGSGEAVNSHKPWKTVSSLVVSDLTPIFRSSSVLCLGAYLPEARAHWNLDDRLMIKQT